MSSEFVYLRAGGTGVIVSLAEARLPRILYWGEDLGAIDAAEVVTIARAALPAVGDSPVTYAQPIPVLGQLSEGWMGRPGLVGDSAGRRWAAKFAHVEARTTSTAEAETLIADATDPEYGLTLRIEIELLHASGLIRQRATLTNAAEETFRVDGLELALPVPQAATEILDLTGRWSLERVPQRREFHVGEWARTSRGGKPGLEHTLLIAAGEAGFGFRSGRVWATHLGWSGNQTLVAERTPADVRRLAASEVLASGEVELARDASYTTPWQYGSWGEGLDELSARFHRHLRALPAYPRSPRPVIVNTWEAVYFEQDLDTLIAFAEESAKIGAERFVVDDGWFLGRRDDTTSLGDWIVDPAVWPTGIEPLVDRVEELGMDFGLWFEPEMINLDSELAREHPEWIFDAGHGVGLPSRHQHVLDLGNPEAYALVLERISALITALRIAYVKWDHNRYLLDAGHAEDGRAGLRAQTLAAYALMDELAARHPGLEIESCASGGGRIDLGVLERTQRVWPSDCNDPHERLEIQRWTSLVVPPELQGTHIGAEESHTTHRSHPLSYRGEKALWGHLGVETNLLTADAETKRGVAAWIDFHKAHRALLHGGTVVHADLSEPAARFEGVVSPARDEALYAFSITERPRTWPVGRIGFPGLDDAVRYTVSAVYPDGARPSGVQPPWMVDGVTMSGKSLRLVGLESPSLDPDRSVLFHVVAVSDSAASGAAVSDGARN
ncbi:alpha-galactosidase [Mycetocola sp. BIGb0189]|uniref:alpha-galactosidase n=1 Tax=Mycetocola sp. BIGb0189 TaxID=2940604 RepID=UPI002167C6B9|nr:alpha-galactosidase [Mycetocola sp. BIGb0189]MCS4274938.1 alpha-galactosidase [Mycetocola sp. BIGb0189]